MYLRRCHRAKDGKRHAYWALVKSVRTAQGPRQEVVAYLGDLDEAGRLGVQQAAHGDDPSAPQRELFDTPQGRFVEVDVSGIVVEGMRKFGGPWLALQLINKLGLKGELERLLPAGREDVPWSIMALVLVICRLCDPSSELRIAEHLYERSALPDLLGVGAEKITDDRLYRALDELLPHKAALETHLKNRLGELFNLSYDLLLYDVTSTYFEGQCQGNEQAQRGYSRDSRGDCKQVCLGLVVSRCGMPLGYELFAGNKADVTTVRQIVTTMEQCYGKADRVWVMDRGMVSAANVEFLKEGGRRYILGTHKTLMRKYEHQLIAPDWRLVHEGLEVKLCAAPDGGDETFILCRSAARREKEKAMHEKFEKRIEEGLAALVKLAEKRALTAVAVSHRVGRLLGQNTRAAGAFTTEVTSDAQGKAALKWEKVEAWRSWARLSEGCYLLRSNVNDWTACSGPLDCAPLSSSLWHGNSIAFMILWATLLHYHASLSFPEDKEASCRSSLPPRSWASSIPWRSPSAKPINWHGCDWLRRHRRSCACWSNVIMPSAKWNSSAGNWPSCGLSGNKYLRIGVPNIHLRSAWPFCNSNGCADGTFRKRRITSWCIGTRFALGSKPSKANAGRVCWPVRFLGTVSMTPSVGRPTNCGGCVPSPSLARARLPGT